MGISGIIARQRGIPLKPDPPKEKKKVGRPKGSKDPYAKARGTEYYIEKDKAEGLKELAENGIVGTKTEKKKKIPKPKKTKPEGIPQIVENEELPVIPKRKRGRPPKNKSVEEAITPSDVTTENNKKTENKTVKKGIVIKPQPGPQTEFLSTPADICIYGGAAGGGKSWSLLVEPLRHINNSRFNAIIFRKNAVQVRSPGGLWDASMNIYPALGAKPRELNLEWEFPSGAIVKFAHLETENTRLSYQGTEIVLIGFDELTHFSRSQFFYMLSRNRTTCGVRPYMRATCNPDSDSWVADFLSWWIDQDTGYAIKERSGVIRWLIVVNDTDIWADTKEELIEKYGDDVMPKSVTFISSSLFDNKILMDSDPGYLANLKALGKVERERLLEGNWKIRPSAGNFFRREWISVIEPSEVPKDLYKVRGWDFAGTKPNAENKDPDYTVGVLMGKSKSSDTIYVLHGLSLRDTPGRVEDTLLNIASQDGKTTTVAFAQDPGQAGKAQVEMLTKKLLGYRVATSPESGNKEVRFRSFSSSCEHGNVVFVRGDWNDEFFDFLEKFPSDGVHDDHADACSRAYNTLMQGRPPMKINPNIVRPRLLRLSPGFY